MSKLKVITNHHWRHTVDAWELTEKERAEFDYLDWPAIEAGNDSATFFRYKGQLYDLNEFTMCQGELYRMGWHGVRHDSFFSGIVIRYDEHYEQIQVGLALS